MRQQSGQSEAGETEAARGRHNTAIATAPVRLVARRTAISGDAVWEFGASSLIVLTGAIVGDAGSCGCSIVPVQCQEAAGLARGRRRNANGIHEDRLDAALRQVIGR